MPDNKNYPNPEEMSLDALLEETRMQIDAAPGESGTMLDDVMTEAQQEFNVTDEPEAPAQVPQDDDFTPDFGNAFSDYGTYEEPAMEQDDLSYPEDDFDDEIDDLYEDELPDAPKKPKRRTGKRFIPLFVKILLYIVIVGVISVGLGYGAWECAKDVLGFGRSTDEVRVYVNEGDTIDDVAEMLKEQGIIKYPWLFKLYCSFTDSGDSIQPNEEGYVLYYNYDYHALVDSLAPEVAARETIYVTIPEGYTAAQIFALMEDKNVCGAEDLKECSANYEFDYWFLEGIPYGADNRLEGFLFPDTYEFYAQDTPERVLDKLLSNFEKKFGDGARTRLDELNDILADRWRKAGYGDQYIADHAFTVYELMTVAAMIEKETAGHDESGNISSVIYNRLCNPANYPYLNIDATIIYALGGNVTLPLTNEHLKVDSPYNTYKVAGLPAGPICNPGLSSISAALYPTDTNYYYYALDTATNYHHFSKTKQEHDAFLEGQNYGG